MTQRLYYTNSYLTAFQANVVERSSDGKIVYLDSTAFYPSSGGQPHDKGTLAGVPVVNVVDEGDRVAHVLERATADVLVEGVIDWQRRFDFMQQHTGQHLLSAVFAELLGFTTVSVHFGEESSTVDLDAVDVSPEQLRNAEERANQVVCENHPIGVTFESREEVAGLRKETPREGVLRIVAIQGVDRSACGGTHVRATGEIGAIHIRKVEKIRSNVRLEFLCGGRATRRARADFDTLSQIARLYSVSLDEVPGTAAAQALQLREIGKVRRRLATELAQRQGRELYDGAMPDAMGRRTLVRTIDSIDDDVRTLAQSFTSRANAIFVAFAGDSVLLAASPDSGIHAGNRLKDVLRSAGGRGGGNAQVAQGTAPNPIDPAVLVR